MKAKEVIIQVFDELSTSDLQGEHFIKTLIDSFTAGYYKFTDEVWMAAIDKDGVMYLNPNGFEEHKEDLIKNNEYSEAIFRNDTKFIILHESLHQAGGHFLRDANKNPELWNIATDFWINTFIRDKFGIKPSKTLENKILFPEKFKIPIFNTSDEYYDYIARNPELKQEIQEYIKGNEKIIIDLPIDADEPKTGKGRGKEPKTGRGKGDKSETGKGKENEPKTGKGRGDGLKTGKERGKGTIDADGPERGYINRFHRFKEEVEKKGYSLDEGVYAELSAVFKKTQAYTNWKYWLKKYLTLSRVLKVSWSKPNRRYLPHGIILPSYEQEQELKAVIGIDISGSISEKELEIFFNETDGIIKQLRALGVKKYIIHIIYFHTSIVKEVVFDSKRDKSLFDFLLKNLPSETGGTSFVQLISRYQYLIKHYKSKHIPLIVLTDLDGEFPKYRPQGHILWLTTGLTKAPFGQVVIYKPKKEE
ncbi:MAG: VWA-like domain-containing protein [candidate division WOR-3 bacterium]